MLGGAAAGQGFHIKANPAAIGVSVVVEGGEFGLDQLVFIIAIGVDHVELEGTVRKACSRPRVVSFRDKDNLTAVGRPDGRRVVVLVKGQPGGSLPSAFIV